MSTSCGVNKKNLGTGLCNDLPQILRRHITTADDFVATKAQIESQTFWQEQIALGNAYYWPAYSTVPEYIGSETTYRDNPVNYSKLIDGRYRWRTRIEKNLCFHKAANSHSGRGGKVWLIDAANRVYGTFVGLNGSNVATYSGFSMDLLQAENMMFATESDPSESPFVIALSTPSEVNDSVYGAYGFSVPFINVLKPLTDVIIEVTAATASLISFTVTLACDGTPVLGLVKDDFTYVDDTGAAVTTGTFTEVGSGAYTLASSAAFADDDVIGLVSAEDISLYPNSVYYADDVTVVVP
jgi:hypothetical protein